LELRRLELRAGEQHVITLEGLGAAGYVWTFHVDGSPGIVSIAKKIGAAPALPSHTPETFSVQESFTIAAALPGRVVVTFLQMRPWESDETPPRAQIVFEILVKRPSTQEEEAKGVHL
jgi:hypothetical protein